MRWTRPNCTRHRWQHSPSSQSGAFSDMNIASDSFNVGNTNPERNKMQSKNSNGDQMHHHNILYKKLYSRYWSLKVHQTIYNIQSLISLSLKFHLCGVNLIEWTESNISSAKNRIISSSLSLHTNIKYKKIRMLIKFKDTEEEICFYMPSECSKRLYNR